MNVDVKRHNSVIPISSIVAIEEKFIVVPVVVVCKYIYMIKHNLIKKRYAKMSYLYLENNP